MDTDKITEERLAGWRQRLKEENATPICGIGVSHGEKSGQIVLLVPEGVEDDLLLGALRYALAAIERGSMPQKHGERATFTRG